MEKHLKKAKITLPKIKKKTWSKRRLLMVSAMIIDTTAFLSPLLWEQYTFLFIWRGLSSYPDVPREGWFWSFISVTRTTMGECRFSVFWDYWFGADAFHHGGTIWLLIFIFQVLTILTALATLFGKIRSKRLGTLITIILSLALLILCVHQRFIQQSYFLSNCQFSIGFWLTIASTLLSSISLLKAKI